jgi:hypothetical protein
MSQQVHSWFDRARFALKPIRQFPGAVVVQWHWLKKPVLKPKVGIRSDYDPLLQAGLTDQIWGDYLGGDVRTGQTFTIRAENPEDLPSWELLQLQWDMQRVATICGAADVTDDYYDLDDQDCAQDETIIARQRVIFEEQWARGARDKEGIQPSKQTLPILPTEENRAPNVCTWTSTNSSHSLERIAFTLAGSFLWNLSLVLESWGPVT